MALHFPDIYLLAKNLSSDEQLDLEEQIPSLTYDANEAEVFLGKVQKKERAQFELRRLNIITEEFTQSEATPSPAKRRRLTRAPDDSRWADSSATDDETVYMGSSPSPKAAAEAGGVVRVVKLAWFTDSVAEGQVLPYDKYLVYEGRKLSLASNGDSPTAKRPRPNRDKILERALIEAASPQFSRSSNRAGHGAQYRRSLEPRTHLKRPALHPESTSEHDIDRSLPKLPEWLHSTYSCQRPTPLHPPNEPFVKALLRIREIRTLQGDKIGIRAYSSAVAAVAAYPYTLQSAYEVERLPGCGEKIAAVYQEFKATGKLQEAELADADPRMAVLKLFYEIWGAGEATAREFYNKGWRDLDDVVEYGWNGLTRVQKIGVKFYDDFLIRIPRTEVEWIADTVLQHANKIRPGYEMVIVGGHRRGKPESGDVDMIVSHRDEAATHNFIIELVTALEKTGHITHTLTLSTHNSERGQTPVAWKGNEKKPGTGFDTLDKALVVWQDPRWEKTDEVQKNPNIHRRVDIIISPWKTAGCAVLGWTSGTTFQRDLRRYCKTERGLKFDSSGIRSRQDGHWVDLESDDKGQPAPDMYTAERRIFDGLKLTWRPPEDRNTG